jgi:hypothetical protein
MGILGTRLLRHCNFPITLVCRGSLDIKFLQFLECVSSTNF